MNILKKITKYVILVPYLIYNIPSLIKKNREDTKKFEPYEGYYFYLQDLEENTIYKPLCKKLKRKLLLDSDRNQVLFREDLNNITDLSGIMRLIQLAEKKKYNPDLIKIIGTYLNTPFFEEDLIKLHPNLYYIH